MSYRLTRRAREDVTEFGDFIAERNPRAAARLVEALRMKWRALAEHPSSGSPREDLSPGLRHAVVGNYLSFYRLADGVVLIVRVIDGRRRVDETDFE